MNVAKIRALAPTHLVVNIDENEKPTVAELAEFIPNVIVTHPQAPLDNLELFRLFGGIFGGVGTVAARAAALESAFRTAYDAITSAPATAPRTVLYCIWQDPWMTVAPQTYIGQMLALIGWRQWSGVRGAVHAPVGPQSAGSLRYPRFDWSSELVQGIDGVLLSTEPYRFTQVHVDHLEQQIGKPVQLVDGEMLSWYGSRSIAGLRYLATLRDG